MLQFNGDIYSCVRGQSKKEFYFGNIYKDTVADIMKNAVLKIRMCHNYSGFAEKCQKCDHLGICKTGCPFVKNEMDIPYSYTCELQKELYLTDHQRYKPFFNQNDKKLFVELYKMENHPQLMFSNELDNIGKVILPNDLNEDKNSLEEIIKNDALLKQIYEAGNIILELNNQKYELQSQIRKKNKQIIIIKDSDEIKLYIKKTLLEVNCNDLIKNSLYLMMLRDTKVTYGDEQRTKQEHIFTHLVFYNILEHVELNSEDYVFIDVTKLFHLHSKYFLDGVLNNFFITTALARDYHYQKQKDNAFYHIQAINIPFSNIEFYWRSDLDEC